MILFRIILSSFLTHVYGWGSDGHEAITSLARKLMTSRNADSLLEPLGDLMEASTWADSAEAEKKYPLSGAYHFSNTPYRNCQAFDMNRDCGFGRTKGLCIVTGLSEAILLAIDPKSSETDRTDSLKFILHLMADIHQPLHTGFREDTGGLRIILGQPKGVDLHAIWDITMIDQLRNSSGSVDIQQLHNRLNAKSGAFLESIRAQTNLTRVVESQALITEYIAAIATDTATTATCRSAYVRTDKEWIGVGDAITPEYLASKVPSVTVQVLKASVRLALLLDTIADTLYTRRMSLKAARRSKRIAKLFERKCVDSDKADDRLDSNRFTALFIDFESILTDTTPMETQFTRRVPIKRESDDDAVFEEHMKAAEVERASYTFYGVDLSEVAYVKTRGMAVISSRTAMRVRDYIPENVHGIKVDFINRAGVKTIHQFGFDKVIFREKMNDELIIRTLLAVSGIDPRIDITDYLAIYKPHHNAPADEQSLIWRSLFFAHSRRTKETTSYESRIKSLKGKIIGANIKGMQIQVFIHSETLRARNNNFHTRMNRFEMVYAVRGKITPLSVITVFYDPAIIDAPSSFSGKELYGLLLDNALPITRSTPQDIVLFSEISEIEVAVRLRKSGTLVADHLAGKYVEWFFDYDGDQVGSYWVVEWFHRGATEEQIMKFLKLKPEPVRTYTDDYSIVPRGFGESDIGLIKNATEKYFALGATNADRADRQLMIALQRIESGLEHIMAFQVGNIKAFYSNATGSSTGLKFVVDSVDGNRLADPVIYLIDPMFLHNLKIPRSMMDPIISKLESIAEGRWQTSHPSRPNFVAQLTAIEYLVTSNETDEVKLSSPLRAPIRAIGDFKPAGAEYGLLVWF